MSFTITNKTIDKFLGFLIRLDNNSKKKLIIKLTESIEISSPQKNTLKSIFGAWDDLKDSDEIIKSIKKSRFDDQNLAEF